MVFHQKKLQGVYQVCWQLDQENMDREIAGLMEAMDFFELKSALIITIDQTDQFILEDKTIHVVPFYEWAEEQYTKNE